MCSIWPICSTSRNRIFARRDASALHLRSATASFVNAPETYRPLRGPDGAPPEPCIRHLRRPFIAGAWHEPPRLVRAPQRSPEKSGPNFVDNELRVMNAPCMALSGLRYHNTLREPSGLIISATADWLNQATASAKANSFRLSTQYHGLPVASCRCREMAISYRVEHGISNRADLESIAGPRWALRVPYRVIASF